MELNEKVVQDLNANIVGIIDRSYTCMNEGNKCFEFVLNKKVFMIYLINNEYFLTGLKLEGSFFNEFDILNNVTIEEIKLYLNNEALEVIGMDYDTITKAQERCLEKRLNKNISLKKLNLWFKSLENTFKNNIDILNFIKKLKLRGQSHYVKLSLYTIEKNYNTLKILKRTESGLTEHHEHIGVFKIELLENIINELLEECNYVSICENSRIIQIIESEVKK